MLVAHLPVLGAHDLLRDPEDAARELLVLVRPLHVHLPLGRDGHADRADLEPAVARLLDRCVEQPARQPRAQRREQLGDARLRLRLRLVAVPARAVPGRHKQELTLVLRDEHPVHVERVVEHRLVDLERDLARAVDRRDAIVREPTHGCHRASARSGRKAVEHVRADKVQVFRHAGVEQHVSGSDPRDELDDTLRVHFVAAREVVHAARDGDAEPLGRVPALRVRVQRVVDCPGRAVLREHDEVLRVRRDGLERAERVAVRRARRRREEHERARRLQPLPVKAEDLWVLLRVRRALREQRCELVRERARDKRREPARERHPGHIRDADRARELHRAPVVEQDREELVEKAEPVDRHDDLPAGAHALVHNAQELALHGRPRLGHGDRERAPRDEHGRLKARELRWEQHARAAQVKVGREHERGRAELDVERAAARDVASMERRDFDVLAHGRARLERHGRGLAERREDVGFVKEQRAVSLGRPGRAKHAVSASVTFIHTWHTWHTTHTHAPVLCETMRRQRARAVREQHGSVQRALLRQERQQEARGGPRVRHQHSDQRRIARHRAQRVRIGVAVVHALGAAAVVRR
ncbi:hypothetical protein PybrP1_001157 [[Pythium] brassicae (nom. inval.)]|nr:hypothetical protein PybrP1_001157 [[Pythium] brassicae (nom. inval.)]